MPDVDSDVVVLGGGFFGCEIALAMRDMGFSRVQIVEAEAGIFRRASYVNQARVHHGYHYPRSLATAQRSRANYQRFLSDYGYAIHWGMEHLYAIGRGSRVSATQFDRMCAAIGAPCEAASRQHKLLFAADMVDEIFLTRELAFDAGEIAKRTAERLVQRNVDVALSSPARVSSIGENAVTVETANRTWVTRFVVNATYAGLNTIGVTIQGRLKRELAELVLFAPPPDLARMGVTVVDGPFFSAMPFPAQGLHSLSHVRYTPHEAALDDQTVSAPQRSNAVRMIRDAARYMPVLRRSRPERSLFEIKTVLQRNERDDGRPILFETSAQSPRIVSILGAKVDNIYDVIDAVRCHAWTH